MATQDIFNLTDTWNDSGKKFDSIKMDVTDTASQAASNLQHLLVGSVTKHRVQKDGSTFQAGDVVFIGSTNNLIVSGSDQATGERTATIPDLGSTNSTFAFLEQNQTFTGTTTHNGTLDVSSGTLNLPAGAVDAITEIASGLKSGADTVLITGTAGTSGDLAQWNVDGDLVDGPTPPSGSIVGTTDTQTLSNKTLDNSNAYTAQDTNFTLQDNTDNTKQANFELSSITTSTTRTYTLPDVTDTIVTLAATQTLSNKTLTSPIISTSIDLPSGAVDAIGEIASGLKSGSDATIVTGTAGTNGDLAQWNIDGDLVDGPTPPSGTIVGTTDTQTLTNKTIDAGNNTLAIATSDLSDVASPNVKAAGQLQIWNATNSQFENATLTEGTGVTITEGDASITITASGSDADAIHDNVSGEISAVTEKTTPVDADLLLIEDSAASNAKKRIQIGNLPSSGGGDTINVETLAADKTLTNTDATVQALDPGGVARNVDLPAEENNLRFIIKNTGTAAGDDIAVRNDAGTNVADVHAGSSVEVMSDGTSWFITRAVQYTEQNGNKTAFGDRAEATGNPSAAFGDRARASGNISTALGSGSTASGAFSTSVGSAASSTNLNATAVGQSTWAGADNASAIGRDAQASDENAIALGAQSETSRVSEIVNNIDAAATQQNTRGSVGFLGTTTDTNSNEIFCGGVSNERLTIKASSILVFTAHIAARDNSTGNCAAYRLQGAIKRDGSNNTALVGSVTEEFALEDDAAYAVSVSADDTNESLKIAVTAATTNSTQWVASVDFVETKF